MESITNPLQACKLITLKPNSVFATIKEKHNWAWIPFLIIALCSLVPSVLFFDMIDFEWYKNMLLQAQHGDVSPAEQEMFKQGMDLEQLKSFTFFGTIASLAITNALFAVYLNMFTKSDESITWTFSDWYAFGWWVSFPTAFTALLGALVIMLFGEPQMQSSIIIPTSLAFLLNIPMDSEYFLFGQAVRLEYFWMMYLTVVGLSQWTEIPLKKTYIIAVAPFAIIWFMFFVTA